MDVLVIDQDKVGCEKRSANHRHVVCESFHLVRGVLVHKFAHWEIKYLLHVTLLKELVEHGFHPLEENVGPSHYLEVIANAKSDTQYQSAILHAVCREIVAQLGLKLSEKHKVLAQVSVKYTSNDQLPHVSLCLDGNVFKQVGIIPVEHYLKCSG